MLESDFEVVRKRIEQYYKTTQINQFEILFQQLKTLDPSENVHNMEVFIRVFQNINGEPIYLTDYNEHDQKYFNEEMYFDVCGKNNEQAGLHSIAGCKHADFLGYFVKENTLHKFTKASILAHCLWEITFLGFDNSKLAYDY